jgi:hypothetical protein
LRSSGGEFALKRPLYPALLFAVEPAPKKLAADAETLHGKAVADSETPSLLETPSKANCSTGN